MLHGIQNRGLRSEPYESRPERLRVDGGVVS